MDDDAPDPGPTEDAAARRARLKALRAAAGCGETAGVGAGDD